MADFILNLGGQGQLASHAGGPGDPLSFREGADDLAVGMMFSHAEHAHSIGVGHPVARFDQPAIGDVLFELGEFLWVFMPRLFKGLDRICSTTHVVPSRSIRPLGVPIPLPAPARHPHIV